MPAPGTPGPDVTLVLAVAAGLLIGLALGALGGGGSILAVPVLVYLLDQSPAQATTGSLVVVGVTAIVGAMAAAQSGHVLLARGATFGLVAVGGAVLGAKASAHVDEDILLAAFAALMIVVGGVMALRQLRHHRTTTTSEDGAPGADGPQPAARPGLDDPIITFSPTFACACPRALKVLVTATLVGLLTGFLGVGGGFLVVPALVLGLALPMAHAAGTSLVVITITSTAALVARAGAGSTPDWNPVLVLTATAAVAAVLGVRLAARTETARLSVAFTVLVLAVATYTAVRAVPALL